MDPRLHPMMWSEPLPEAIDYPHNYTPRPIAKAAAHILMDQLEAGLLHDFHDFGLGRMDGGLGKMIGVLVVLDQEERLGFIKAFSGRLDKGMNVEGWVPPVYNILEDDSFFIKKEKEINKINSQIESLENALEYRSLKEQLIRLKINGEQELKELQETYKNAKRQRDKIRKENIPLMTEDEAIFTRKELERESSMQHFHLKDVKKQQDANIAALHELLQPLVSQIDSLKEIRKNKSGKLQNQIFENFSFLNINGETKSLLQLFQIELDLNPPAGAGECAAPKMLQYALKHKWKPIAMAEFWWGKSPDSEIRNHKQYYPACRGKCKPILEHMLQGLDVSADPAEIKASVSYQPKILYQDTHLLAIDKPSGMLSVPGRKVRQSAQSYIQQVYGREWIAAHRLDQNTSGILLFVSSKDVYQHIQRQFTSRSVHKEYIAVCEGQIFEKSGIIDLPLCSDIINRPRQMVSYERGKPAITHWRVLSTEEGKSYIKFEPKTGRTHQLRVHAAHPLGLNAPIAGDELYGNKADRLLLHSYALIVKHPVSDKEVMIMCKAPFYKTGTSK